MKQRKVIGKLLTATVLLTSLVGMTLPKNAYAAFPGLNGRIVFTSTRSGAINNLYNFRSDGSDATRLTTTASGSGDFDPAYSPDGTKVVFTNNTDGDNEIYVMNSDGSNIVQLTTNTASDNRPGWSPDGTKIAFDSNRDTGTVQQVYTMNADGTGVIRLTNTAFTDARAVFSPSGAKIAFDTNRDGNFEVYEMNADGTGQTRLTNATGNDQRPDYSPDGTLITFSATRDGNSEIYRMNVNGTSQTRLTNNSLFDGAPAFSPDGTKITFQQNVSGTDVQVMTMNIDGTGQLDISNNTVIDAGPDWQPLTIEPPAVNASPEIDASNGAVVLDAPANHTDVYEGVDETSVTITTQPAKGSVSVNTVTGEITYTAADGATGTDSFVYQICSLAHADLCNTVTIGVVLGLADTGSAQTLINMVSAVVLITLAIYLSFIPKKYSLY